LVLSDYYVVPTFIAISKATIIISVFPQASLSVRMDGGMCIDYINKAKSMHMMIDCYNDGVVILTRWTTKGRKTSYQDATREITSNLLEELRALRGWFDDESI
jgi:hypothetical protein